MEGLAGGEGARRSRADSRRDQPRDQRGGASGAGCGPAGAIGQYRGTGTRDGGIGLWLRAKSVHTPRASDHSMGQAEGASRGREDRDPEVVGTDILRGVVSKERGLENERWQEYWQSAWRLFL